MIIREATRSELPAVAKMAATMVRDHHAADPVRFFVIPDQEQEYEEYLVGELRDDNVVILVAVEAEVVVGYVYARVEPRNWYELVDEHGRIHDVFVEESARGKGIGRALVAAGMDYLYKRGMRVVVSTLRADNEASRKMFEACGWQISMFEMTHKP